MQNQGNDILRIKRLILENFRGFDRRELEFSDRFNVFIGDNATGKTAILDALAICLGQVLEGLPPIDGDDQPRIEDDDVYLVGYPSKGVYQVEPQYPASVTCEADLVGERESWGVKRSSHGQTTIIHQIAAISSRLWEGIRDGRDVTLPLIAYYAAERLHGGDARTPSVAPGDNLSHLVEPMSRTQGYGGCLKPQISVEDFARWFATLTIAEIQERTQNPHLRAAKRALAGCLKDCEEVIWEVRRSELVIRFEDGRILPFRTLSHGYRSVLAMVADMAWRASVLNPNADDPAAETPGVVLIDELDLHLHPKWQREVVEQLRTTFPRVQFFTTTHSPFIIQAMQAEEVIDLSAEGRPVDTRGSIEDIVEDAMRVELPQRSRRHQRMMETAEKYYKLLQGAPAADAPEREQLKKKLDELIEPFSDDVAYYTFLKMEREAAGLGEQNQ